MFRSWGFGFEGPGGERAALHNLLPERDPASGALLTLPLQRTWLLQRSRTCSQRLILPLGLPRTCSRAWICPWSAPEPAPEA